MKEPADSGARAELISRESLYSRPIAAIGKSACPLQTAEELKTAAVGSAWAEGKSSPNGWKAENGGREQCL